MSATTRTALAPDAHTIFDLSRHAQQRAFDAVQLVCSIVSPSVRAGILVRVAYRMLDAAACAYVASQDDMTPARAYEIAEKGFEDPEVLAVWQGILAAWQQAPDRDAMDRVMAERLNATPVTPDTFKGGPPRA